MQEACVKTVSCPNSINGLNGERSSTKALFPAFGEHALRTALDDNDGNEMRQDIERSINVSCLCDFTSFVFVRQKNIDAFEHGLDVIGPKIIRVIVGIE